MVGILTNIAKALNLPAGSSTQTEQQVSAQVPASGQSAEAMPRSVNDYVVPFAPGKPLVPFLINPPSHDGRATPRRYEFPVAWNLQITEQRVVPFKLLRDVADGSDLARKCIEVVKASIAGMEWDIVMSPEAADRVVAEMGDMKHTAAAREARTQLLPEITRCRDFWAMPDRINGMSFPEWIGMALEEMLVIDALTIYPNKTVSDDLHSLVILDGATIKPLLDETGNRPAPPYPAFQQILWGFPRGEFTASADVDGEFSADDLIYAPRTRRPFTPYGYSAVERSLPVIDLYMKRLQWLRTEFTDGTIPEAFITTDATFGGNPELLKAYERIMNDDLAGKLEQRRRMRLLAEGMNPIFAPNMDTKFNPLMDEYIVKQVCSHFGILPTQIGFSPKGGLGGSGLQENESDYANVQGLKPIIAWLTELLNQLSYRFLGMPRDLVFIFHANKQADTEKEANRRFKEINSGQKTLNEARTELGLPLFDFAEADMPLVPVNMSPLILNDELAMARIVPRMQQQMEAVDGSGSTFEPKPSEPSDRTEGPSLRLSAELGSFKRWTKGSRSRDFRFDSLDESQSLMLNALAKHDPQAARDMASMLLKDADAGGRDVAPRFRWGRT